MFNPLNGLSSCYGAGDLLSGEQMESIMYREVPVWYIAQKILIEIWDHVDQYTLYYLPNHDCFVCIVESELDTGFVIARVHGHKRLPYKIQKSKVQQVSVKNRVVEMIKKKDNQAFVIHYYSEKFEDQ
jgi:hypothetical protein